MKKITIGIPTYNEDKFIEETLNNVLAWADDSMRIIVSDNCSTDNTRKILAKFEDSNIEIHLQEKNIGAYNNFRYMFELCDTPYFAWLGGHDMVSNGYYSKACDFLDDHKEYSACFAPTLPIDSASNVISDYAVKIYDFTQQTAYQRQIAGLEDIRNCTVFHSVFRTQMMQQFKWDEGRVTDVRIIHYWLWHGKLHYLRDEHFIRRFFFEKSKLGANHSAGFDKTKGILAKAMEEFIERTLQQTDSLETDSLCLRGYDGLSQRRIRIAQRHKFIEPTDREWFMYFDDMAIAPTLRKFSDRLFFAASKREYELLAKTNPVYVYGAGYMGRLLLKMMKFNDIKLTGFIETSPSTAYIEGIPVSSPEQVPEQAEVIVASEYWRDIYHHIDNLGVCFSTIRRALF